MQKVILKLSPFFFFLLIFSCKQESPLPVDESPKDVLQARGDQEERPCDGLCKKIDALDINQINGCSAMLEWESDGAGCGAFNVSLQDISTGAWITYGPLTGPYRLINLTPCTNYIVRVWHSTDQCDGIPYEAVFRTECTECVCEAPCRKLDFASSELVTMTSANIVFGFLTDGSLCGSYTAALKNNETGITNSIDPVASPLTLTNLDPCASYTISISHLTDWCASAPIEVSFMTECPTEYCDASGEDGTCLRFSYYTVTNSSEGPSLYPTLSSGYIDLMNESLDLEPGETYPYAATGFCFCTDRIGDIYIKLWIDFDQNLVFENSELVLFHSNSNTPGGVGGLFCFDAGLAGFTVPNINECGLRARYIISEDASAGPCGTFSTGQVVDFMVNIGDC